eukprot:CAMPEP_0179294328 /NCGR_PEP_ID=MMETSP0797-20121207/43841_1 /TAXON_ID=47934 /ORGANISM="Dinophysis acuminata, Strain DAEP01" /LENGTH=65 /DNA_ID=CAMNT_0021003521 /DNA_START=151 /DNA_END=344 /DNA_ORIENTATION=+
MRHRKGDAAGDPSLVSYFALSEEIRVVAPLRSSYMTLSQKLLVAPPFPVSSAITSSTSGATCWIR